MSPGTPRRFDVTKLATTLADLNDRLAGVIFENLPFGEFIGRYDGEGVLFYLDTPYAGGEKDYGPGVFERARFAAPGRAARRDQGGLHPLDQRYASDPPDLRHLQLRAGDFDPYDRQRSRDRARELIIMPQSLVFRPPPAPGLFD